MAARPQALRLAARALEQRLNGYTSDHVEPKLPCPYGRAYYHCAHCESGFCPWDRGLGLESFSLTPGVLRMTASAAALVSFEESSGLLHELAGVEVSAKQAERPGEAVGAEIAVDEHQQVEKMGGVAPTMYLGMDGTGVPMRAQPRGPAIGTLSDSQIAASRFASESRHWHPACFSWSARRSAPQRNRARS